MKLEELMKDETKVTGLLRKTDWLSDGPSVQLAEDVLYELWKLDHVKAIMLWEKHAPCAVAGVLPGFIAHRAISDGIDFE